HELGLDQLAELGRGLGQAGGCELEHLQRLTLAAEAPQRAAELELDPPPLLGVLDPLDGLREVLRGSGEVDAPLDEAELTEQVDALRGRRRLLERAAQIRHGRLRRPP